MNVSGQLHAPATLPLGKSLGSHLMEGWVGPRTSLDILARRKISCPYWDSNQDSIVTMLSWFESQQGHKEEVTPVKKRAKQS